MNKTILISAFAAITALTACEQGGTGGGKAAEREASIAEMEGIASRLNDEQNAYIEEVASDLVLAWGCSVKLEKPRIYAHAKTVAKADLDKQGLEEPTLAQLARWVEAHSRDNARKGLRAETCELLFEGAARRNTLP